MEEKAAIMLTQIQLYTSHFQKSETVWPKTPSSLTAFFVLAGLTKLLDGVGDCDTSSGSSSRQIESVECLLYQLETHWEELVNIKQSHSLIKNMWKFSLQINLIGILGDG